MKDPANLKQLLVEQSNSLFKKLFIKQRELDKVKNKMLTEIHDGGGASTSFNELSGLIEGLKQLISSRATSFGVTPQDLYSHKQVWEKKEYQHKDECRRIITCQTRQTRTSNNGGVCCPGPTPLAIL